MENPLEPAEIPGVRLKRGIFGYNRPMVDRFIEDITTCYEDVWDDRLRLRDSLATLEEELDRYRSHERELGEALIEAKLAAARIVMDAEQKSAGIMRSAELASERSLAAFRAQQTTLDERRGRLEELERGVAERLELAGLAVEDARKMLRPLRSATVQDDLDGAPDGDDADPALTLPGIVPVDPAHPNGRP